MRQYIYKQPDHFLPLAGIVEIGSAIGGLFSGPPEDKSTVGWQNYLFSVPPLPAYPPADVVVNAFRGVVSPDQLQSIQSSYNQNDGTIKHGDWNARVDSVTPLTIVWFKGAGERGISRSNVSWSAPVLGGGNTMTWIIAGVLVVVLVWILIKK